MNHWIMNARMYAVTPQVEATWRVLLGQIMQEAHVSLTYEPYPAPQPLESLWTRGDLGAVFMCGLPIANAMAPVVPIAAPIPRAAWAGGGPRYRTDLIVRTEAPYRTLEDTFGERAAWTVPHSQSGFNAFRHVLLPHRTAQRPRLYREMTGDLVTARNVLDAVREGRIDVGPLDAYWHLLIGHHAPQLTAGTRVLASTPATTMPAFVASATAPADMVQRLREAFTHAGRRHWFAPFADQLLIEGFAAVDGSSYDELRQWDRTAREAGYLSPA